MSRPVHYFPGCPASRQVGVHRVTHDWNRVTYKPCLALRDMHQCLWEASGGFDESCLCKLCTDTAPDEL